MGITMWFQMKLNPTPPDPTQQMIFAWMPLIFTFMLAGFPAGLVIYWAWNNSLSVTQQYIIMRRSGTDVDLLGNIFGSFGRKKKPVHPAKPTVVAPKAANDSVKPEVNETRSAKSTVKSRRAAARAKAKAKVDTKS